MTSQYPNGLPQTGKILDTKLAEAFNVSSETIRDWLVKYQIPHKKPGSRIVIDCEQFYAGLPDGLQP